MFPGGSQAVNYITAQLVPSGEKPAKTKKPGRKNTGSKAKKGSALGQLLRAAVIGYGGPAAVVAIDVLENRLNKRGYTLGSLAESRDLDGFAFK